MIFEVTKDPKNILHKKLDSIEFINSDIKQLAQDMIETMITAKGVGIAGNQVDKDLAIFVIDEKLAQQNNVSNIWINPEITEYSKETDSMEEGCLSIPGWWRPVIRSKKIKIKALDIDGNKLRIKARGFLARVLQHEYDHLQGLLIKDRVKKQS